MMIQSFKHIISLSIASIFFSNNLHQSIFTNGFTIASSPHQKSSLRVMTNPKSFLVRNNSVLLSLSSQTDDTTKPKPTPTPKPSEGMELEHIEPPDAIIHILPKAMRRLRELKSQQQDPLVLRMGVRNGGCSGLSYVMDISNKDSIVEDDAVDDYNDEGILCVVDAKSLLYLYGLELDYSDQLIGGGFKFFNPNAEESCGCGSSFGV